MEGLLSTGPTPSSFIIGPFPIKFPIVTLKIYHHRKEKSYRGPMEVFGNGMTRGTTWEGVKYLVLTKVQIRITLPEGPNVGKFSKQILRNCHCYSDFWIKILKNMRSRAP